jgi:hypothetical protein
VAISLEILIFSLLNTTLSFGMKLDMFGCYLLAEIGVQISPGLPTNRSQCRVQIIGVLSFNLRNILISYSKFKKQVK